MNNDSNIPTGNYSVEYIRRAIILHDEILQALAFKHRNACSNDSYEKAIIDIVYRRVAKDLFPPRARA